MILSRPRLGGLIVDIVCRFVVPFITVNLYKKGGVEMTMGERLTAARKNSGLTLEQIAEILDISYQAYRKYEKGLCNPSVEVLIKISKMYGLSTDYILGLSDKMK